MGVHTSPGDHAVDERWNRVFRLLSSEPRREIVLSLSSRSSGGWVDLPEAAASGHFDGTLDELRLVLRHRHLPALADAGVVRWQETPFRVGRGSNFEEVAAVVEVLVDSPNELPDRLVQGCGALERTRRRMQ